LPKCAGNVRGILIYCADYRCSHSLAISANRWTDDVRLSDIEPRFICGACGKRGADVRPNFNSDKMPSGASAIVESKPRWVRSSVARDAAPFARLRVILWRV
jgi:hypothetical protein